jgi:hypothetical protein
VPHGIALRRHSVFAVVGSHVLPMVADPAVAAATGSIRDRSAPGAETPVSSWTRRPGVAQLVLVRAVQQQEEMLWRSVDLTVSALTASRASPPQAAIA